MHSRVWDDDTADPFPFRDVAVLLTPSCKGVHFHRALGLTAADKEYLPQGNRTLSPMLDVDVERKLDGSWADLKTRVLEAARTDHSRSSSSGKEPALKRPRVLDTKREAKFASFGRSGVGRDTAGSETLEGLGGEEKVLVEQVTGELERYQRLRISPQELDTREVLQRWRTSGCKMFPYLAPVAQQVLGNQASAAQVERDFSGAGNLLVPNRSRMDTYWVEMVMFLYVIFQHIPDLKGIPVIAAKNIRRCLPARFTGVSTDMAAAEAAFDVLRNTANSTSDIGL